MQSRIKYWFLATCLGIVPLIALAFLPRPTAAAGLWYVSTDGSNANDCQAALTPCRTINGALGKAASGDTINVKIGTYTSTSGAEVVSITRSMTLLGGWNSNFTSQTGVSTVDGQGVRRGMTVSNTATVYVARFVYQNGLAAVDNRGGGIENQGVLTLARSRLVSNSAGNALGSQGGGIFNSGTLTLTESTIDNNSATGGGGLLNGTSAYARIFSSTISGNYAGDQYYTDGGGGAGIYNAGNAMLFASTVSGNVMRGYYQGSGILNGGILTVANSTISNNRGADGIYSSFAHITLYSATLGGNHSSGLNIVGGYATWKNTLFSGNDSVDCYIYGGYGEVVTSLGYSLMQVNAGCPVASTDTVSVVGALLALEDNGGPVFTQAFLPISPAANGGDPGGCFGPDALLANDARGYARTGRCDIGAYELQPVEFADKTVDQSTTRPGEKLIYQINLPNPGSSPIANMRVTDTLPSFLIYENDTLTATSGSFAYASGVITWTGTVSAGLTVAIQFAVSAGPSASPGMTVSNTATIIGAGEVFSRQADVLMEPWILFLPKIVKPRPGIQGYVSLNGARAADIYLELRRFNGQSFSTQLTTNTAWDGYYNFEDAPSLGPGEIYYVRFLNSNDPQRLSIWGTADIAGYVAGSPVAGGNFDIADVALQSPSPGAQAALPALFQWALRPAAPTDSYQLALFGQGGDPFAQTAPLGYVNSVNVTGLPSDFHSNTPYGWYVNIYSPDGGFGSSYYYRVVSFTNAVAASQQNVEGGAILEAAKPHADGVRP